MTLAPSPVAPLRSSIRWALMCGNFVIGCGVMSAAGTLNDMARSLQVPVAMAGQLIAIGCGRGAPGRGASIGGLAMSWTNVAGRKFRNGDGARPFPFRCFRA